MERACEKQDSVCNLVAVFENNRTPGEAPGSHSLEDQPHSPEHQLSLSPEPWEAPPVKEALKSEFRPVSRTYLSSLKNKLSSGAWRRSCQPGVSPGPETQEPEEKRVVRELLETEQAYVARLHLLDQVFFQELLREAGRSKAFPEDVVKLIFSNISSIYRFHAQFFLPELQRRVDDWAATPRIGDVIQKLAPFLKMYSEYVKNFERAAELLATWMDKSQPFQEVVTRIQRGLQQPDPAAPHVGACAKNPAVRTAAQGICAEAASPGPRPRRCPESTGHDLLSCTALQCSHCRDGTLSRSWDPAQSRLKVCPISRSGCRACGMCTSAWAWRMTSWTPPTPCSERALFSRSLSAAATQWNATWFCSTTCFCIVYPESSKWVPSSRCGLASMWPA
uniref:FYVE, RhoGEF and PH domain containing 2 n=1 Tax=Mus musculus TaxID=10090 RepID=E9PVB8_MOUSE